MDDKFTALLKRLEVVTSRLETMEVPAGAAGGAAAEDEDEAVRNTVTLLTNVNV